MSTKFLVAKKFRKELKNERDNFDLAKNALFLEWYYTIMIFKKSKIKKCKN